MLEEVLLDRRNREGNEGPELACGDERFSEKQLEGKTANKTTE